VAAAAAAAGLAAGSLISLMSSKDSEQVEEEAVPANKEGSPKSWRVDKATLPYWSRAKLENFNTSHLGECDWKGATDEELRRRAEVVIDAHLSSPELASEQQGASPGSAGQNSQLGGQEHLTEVPLEQRGPDYTSSLYADYTRLARVEAMQRSELETRQPEGPRPPYAARSPGFGSSAERAAVAWMDSAGVAPVSPPARRYGSPFGGGSPKEASLPSLGPIGHLTGRSPSPTREQPFLSEPMPSPEEREARLLERAYGRSSTPQPSPVRKLASS